MKQAWWNIFVGCPLLEDFEMHAWGHLHGGRVGVKIISPILHLVWQYYMGIGIHPLTYRWLFYKNNKAENG